MSYEGSQVPYRTARAPEIWEAAEKAAGVLGLRGYAGIDFVLGELPRVVDVNARPTTSIIWIAKMDAGGDRGADIEGEVWGDAGEGGGGVYFPER
jgi:predicted ATP-grasp superfamily ATP-dependent carboligase